MPNKSMAQSLVKKTLTKMASSIAPPVLPRGSKFSLSAESHPQKADDEEPYK